MEDRTGKFSATKFYTSLQTHNDSTQEVGFNLEDNRNRRYMCLENEQNTIPKIRKKYFDLMQSAFLDALSKKEDKQEGREVDASATDVN